ncbi:MAG: hypothetical protein M3P45_09630 [Acidobacteriota bacterium]|nr:hypothetical protein [Acidobacteriota bacterium]
MKIIAVLSALLLCAFPIVPNPQNTNSRSPAEALRSFTSEDGVFRFQYSNMLIRCTGELREEGQARSWFPDDCQAYVPACGASWSPLDNTLVCFAYPKTRLKDSPTFEAGTFSVAEIAQAATKEACISLSSDLRHLAVDPRGRIAMIHGLRFQAFELTGAAASHSSSAYIFRNFHRDRCYELSVTIVTINPGVFDPGTIKEFTTQDRNQVYGHLRQALDSFRFLK